MLGVTAVMMAACAAPIIRTPMEEVEKYPLIDVHSHPRIDLQTPEEFLEVMNAGGISRMNVFAGVRAHKLALLARQYPDRFVVSYLPPIERSAQMKWPLDDEEERQILLAVEKALKSGLYKGLGEVITNRSGASDISADSSVVRRIVQLAGQYNVPINIHCPADKWPEMDRLLRAYPQTVVIWAHAGLYLSPSVIGEFLRDFPNLYFDLALTHATGTIRIRGLGHSFILLGEVIDDGWRQLLESYPDRFLVGFDFGQRGITKSMAKEVGEYFRTMLTQLTSTTARKIAYENAARLYKFQ